jgi:hypothetical protein
MPFKMDLLNTTLVKLRSYFRSLFPYNTDASIELIDALSSNTEADSVVQLSENISYTRHYTSLTHTISSFYKPRDKKAKDYDVQLAEAKKKIQNTLCQHIEIDVERDYHLCAIDVTPNPRPYAKKVEDRGYIKHNEVVNSGKPVTIGHNYSCVLYLTGQGTWALPLAIDRVSTSEKDTVFGVKQWCEIIKDENNHFTDKRCVGVFDAAYSSAYCITSFNDNQPGDAIFIARLRGDRVLQRPYTGEKNSKGRPIIFDKNNTFDLKDETTWGKPAQSSSCAWTTKKGKQHIVHIEVWYDIRMRGHHDAKIQETPLMVARITVRNQVGDLVYARPLWTVISGSWPSNWPITYIWYDYHIRFDAEHFFRFGKSKILLVDYQSSETLNEENWKQFCIISYHQIYHARKLVNNIKKKWETKKTTSDEVLSPSRVQRGMGELLKQLPAITEEVKPRGVPTGNQMGAKIIARPDCEVVKKSALKPTDTRVLSINYRFEKGSNILKPRIKYNGIEKSSIPTEMTDMIDEIQKRPLFEVLPAP